MVPWQVATGLTMVIAGISAILLLDRLDYLAGYWGLIFSEHSWAIAAPALTALASVFAAIHWAARKAGLGDLGRKVEHIDRGPARGWRRARPGPGRGPAAGPCSGMGSWRLQQLT